MRIAICDDDKDYRGLLLICVQTYFKEKIIPQECFEFSSGEELIKADGFFDIIFLDIEMDKLNGIETAKLLHQKNNRSVIFIVTAYQQYLDDAMDLNVFRYIDKPINQKRLFAGLDKAIDYISNNDITFNTREKGIVTMKKSDIVFVEVAWKVVTVTTINETLTSREKMEFFKQKLNSSFFAIPHNSYIVNFKYVVSFTRDKMILKNGATIAIAPKKQSEIRKRFMKFIGEGYGSLQGNI